MVEKYILVVSDHRAQSEYLTDILRHLGYATVVTDTLHGARRLLQKRRWSLILLDQDLDGGRGEELLDFDKELADTRVVMMSPIADWGMFYGLMERGVVDLLATPIQPAQLKRAIQLVEAGNGAAA